LFDAQGLYIIGLFSARQREASHQACAGSRRWLDWFQEDRAGTSQREERAAPGVVPRFIPKQLAIIVAIEGVVNIPIRLAPQRRPNIEIERITCQWGGRCFHSSHETLHIQRIIAWVPGCPHYTSSRRYEALRFNDDRALLKFDGCPVGILSIQLIAFVP